MTDKITLTNLVNLQNETTAVNAINGNNATIVAGFNNTLSLNGQSPNQMQSNLDMNSNQILNLPSPATVNSPARLIDVVTNPTITVPPVGTSGAVVGLLNTANTYSALQAFNGGASISTTFSSTVPFTITSTSSSIFQNASSGQDTLNIGLGAINSGGNIIYAPHSQQTALNITNTAGPISITAVDATTNPSNSFSPGIYLNTLTGGGVTPVGLPGGAQAYGVTITGTGQPTQSTGNIAQVNLVNTSPGPYASTSDSGAMVLNFYGWKAGDTGIQMWCGGANASGSFASPSQSINGDAIGQVAFLGRTNVDWDGNPPVRIDARCTEAQTATAWGGMLSIDTTTTGTTNERSRLGISENILISSDANQWIKGNNTVNGANGGLLIKNGTLPSSALSSAVALVAQNGGLTIPFGNGDHGFLNLGTALPANQGILNIMYPKQTSQGLSFQPTDNNTGTGNAVLFNNAGGGIVGSISTNASNTTYATSSDRALKTNIKSQDEVSDVIDGLEVVNYEFINDLGVNHVGFIAQDLYKVFPAAVIPGNDKIPWMRDDCKLIPILVREIQSLRKRVAKLEKK